MKLKFNFNKRNRYKNICSIEGCDNSACGKYNKQINLGYFDTKEKAIAARKFAERKYNINNFSY